MSLNRRIEGEGEAALQLARTIRGESQLFFTDEFNLRIVKKPRCAGDIAVVVDIVLLSGILPWVVAQPLFLYSGQ